ncbi:TPA: hypothetical protein ACWMEF_005446 [Pseudomonas aeruginosa]
MNREDVAIDVTIQDKHPEQAGGDERTAFELFVRKHCGMPAHIAVNWDAKFTNDAWEGWKARAALAQPSPAQAEQHWPKLEKPAQVGAIRFRAGLSSRLVVEAAQRLYEFESTPEKEAERIERLQAFREQLDPFNLAPHAEAFNEAPAEALKPEQAEAERPVVVGYRSGTSGGIYADGYGLEKPEPLMNVAQHERIVGVLRAKIAQLRQHKNDYMDSGQETYRALQNEIREREAEIARLDGLVSGRTAERDAALARVADMKTMADNYCALLMDANAKLAEMERQEPVALANRGLHAFWVKWTEAAAGLYGPGIKLYAAPVAQAQHSVPEASEQEKEQGWTLDYRFVELVTEIAASRTEFTTSMEATEQVLLAARELLAAAPDKEVPQAWLDVRAERRRQIEAKGWTPEHDDLYCSAELPRAAAAYILNGANDEAPAIWPFVAKWWKPRDARSNYVRAGALILAEIERLDRAAHGKEVGHE